MYPGMEHHRIASCVPRKMFTGGFLEAEHLNGNLNHFDLERFVLYGEQIPNTLSVTLIYNPLKLTDTVSRAQH